MPIQLKRVAEKAARLTGRQDFAGVDIVVHKISQQPYVLEVNKMPRLYSTRREKSAAVASFLRSI
jgi:D-alanine-D-alanine ligase-like ATP-grasp enzyme